MRRPRTSPPSDCARTKTDLRFSWARRVFFAAHPELIPEPQEDDPPQGSPSLEKGLVDVGTTYLHVQL